MSENLQCIRVVNYQPGKILASTEQYRVQRVNSARLKIFRLYLRDPGDPTLEYILQTGAEVVTCVYIPTAHRILKAGWVHTTAAPATASADSLTYLMSPEIFSSEVFPPAFDAYTGTASTHYVEYDSYGYWEPPMRYRITTDTTATDRVYFWLDVQVCGEDV